MPSYIKYSPNHVPINHINQSAPLNGYNTKDDSAKNKKPYLVQASIVGNEPFNPATQVKEGPTYKNAEIIYTVRDKTVPEVVLDKENEAKSILSQRSLWALIASLNDGSFTPGLNLTPGEIKEIIKAKL